MRNGNGTRNERRSEMTDAEARRDIEGWGHKVVAVGEEARILTGLDKTEWVAEDKCEDCGKVKTYVKDVDMPPMCVHFCSK